MPAPPSPSHAPSPRLRRPSSSSSAPPAPLVTRPASSTRSTEARLVVPELIRDPSALESLATTLRTWSPFDAPHSTQANALSPDRPTSARLPAASVGAAGGGGATTAAGALMLGEDDDDDEGGAGQSQDARPSMDEPPLPELGERVAWARWDALLDGANESRRVLILGYSSGGVAVWDCSDLDCWLELLNLPTLDCALDDKARKHFRHGVDRVVGAAVLPPSSSRSASDPLAAHRPLLAVLARPRSHNSSTSVILLYSLRDHRIVSTLAVPGVAHHILANQRFLTVSTTSPLALHVYQPTASTSGYAPTPFSPITDVLAAPTSAHGHESAGPVFDLGAGGRLLVYASSSTVPSSTLSRTPARPGTGILAHRGLFDADSLAFGSPDGSGAGLSVHDAEEVARRVGEGVRSGMAALRERGGAWLRGGGGGGGASEPGTAPSAAGSAYSRSAPQLGMGELPSMSARQATSAPGGTAETSPAAGTVKVVDLVASMRGPAPPASSRSRSSAPPALKAVAHFRPYGQQVALVSLSPASTMVLVAPAAGHSFDVFELKPSVPVGVSATSTAMGAVGGNGVDDHVWHRYRLQRGYTSALAASASWSLDGRFVAVSTAKGTAHLWAVQPGGGTPRIESHLAPQVVNADELAPLSVALGSIARVRQPRTHVNAPSSSSPRAPTHAPMPAAVVFLPKSGSTSSALQPTRPDDRSPPSFQDVLVLRPSTSSATLHRLTAQRSPPPATTPSAAADLVRSGDVGRLASTAVSGLSQLMRSRGGALLGSTAGGSAGVPGPTGASARTASGAAAQERSGAWSVRCVGVAEWAVGREEGASDVREAVRGVEKVDKVAIKGVRYSAFAEIETCSRSPLVLPRSIYQSQQFDFYAFPPDYARYAVKGLSALPLRRLEMRSEVQVRQGDGSTSSDAGPSSSASPSSGARYLGSHVGDSSSSSFEPASFDQPIKTAMHALLDFDHVAPGSPQLPPPTFPNGVPGKHGSWRDSIAIPRSVGPAAIESLGRVRQGLGRVKVPSGITLPGSVGRRRSSVPVSAQQPIPAGVVTAAAYSSSISFDDEDAVFADHLEGSLSTACTSELGDGGGKGVSLSRSVGGDDADEEDWGWDDRVDEDEPRGGAGARRSDSSGALAPLREMAPFDEDFDDLDLGLATSPSPAIAHKAAATVSLAAPSPLALEPIDAERPSAPAAVVERHLAPPVSVFATSLDDSASPSSSPGSTSGFDPTVIIGSGSGSAAVAHRQLLDRPSSAMSGMSILGATSQSLSAPTNGGLSSSSGGSTSGTMIGSQLQSSKGSKKKKGRR